MNNYFVPVLLLAILLSLTNNIAADENAEKTSAVDLPNVLILGDSISIGYTPHVRKILAGKANLYRPMSADGKQAENCGNTKMGLANLDKWLERDGVKWNLIHFNWGLWDIVYRDPPNQDNKGTRDKINGKISFTKEQYAENLELIIEKLEKTGAKLIWANISYVPEGEAARCVGDDLIYNAVAAKIMKKRGIPVNDINTLTKKMKPELMLAPGDVHYKTEGYEIIAKQVAAIIEKELANRNNKNNNTENEQQPRT